MLSLAWLCLPSWAYSAATGGLPGAFSCEANLNQIPCSFWQPLFSYLPFRLRGQRDPQGTQLAFLEAGGTVTMLLDFGPLAAVSHGRVYPAWWVRKSLKMGFLFSPPF